MSQVKKYSRSPSQGRFEPLENHYIEQKMGQIEFALISTKLIDGHRFIQKDDYSTLRGDIPGHCYGGLLSVRIEFSCNSHHEGFAQSFVVRVPSSSWFPWPKSGQEMPVVVTLKQAEINSKPGAIITAIELSDRVGTPA